MDVDNKKIVSCSIDIPDDEWEELIYLYERFWHECARKFGYDSIDEAIEDRRMFTVSWQKKRIEMKNTKEKMATCHWRNECPTIPCTSSSKRRQK